VFVTSALLLGCPGEPPPKRNAPASASAAKPAPPAVDLPEAPPLAADPPFFEPIPEAEENTLTAEKAELGKLLFFDARLGRDSSWSCESCHYPDKGWGDGKKLSSKFGGEANRRHSPTLFNVAYAKEWYWDGREPTLESQILAAWKGQMGGQTTKVAKVLTAIPAYSARFVRAFGGEANEERIVHALASFVRTLRAGPTTWDRFEKGDEEAVGEDAKRGQKLFTGKANCSLCHAPPMYSDYRYHNVGIGSSKGGDGKRPKKIDRGRAKVTDEASDRGAFKTPTLRGAALHPPYFHDGSAATLEEAVDYMLSGGHEDPHLDEQMKPIKLSAAEKKDLIAFLRALTPDTKFARPSLP
jgi:cytochrome c peroxidase